MEYSARDILFRIESLIADRGISEAEFCRSIGASRTAITDWRRRGQAPNSSTLFAISQRYQVSLDYLIMGKETAQINKDALFSNLREKSLLDKYRQLPSELQDMVLTYIDGMLNAVTKNKDTAVS